MACRPEPPQAALYYCEESVRFSRDAGYGDVQRGALFGASALWNRAGYPLHVLNTETLLAEHLEQLKLIYLPATYLIPQPAGGRLRAYVQAGGTLVSECRPAYVGANGWMYLEQPGAGTLTIFGPAMKAANSDISPRGPAPAHGQDNRWLLTELLGKGEDAAEDILASGAMG